MKLVTRIPHRIWPLVTTLCLPLTFALVKVCLTFFYQLDQLRFPLPVPAEEHKERQKLSGVV